MDADEAAVGYQAKMADAELMRHPVGAGPALVYLVAHADLGAVKVGISDPAGMRIAKHRRRGWQLVAAFQVTGKAAVAIERDVLRWWRGKLGLPVYLAARHMPQGGWTETVDAGRVDLAATVTRTCAAAVEP